MTLNNGVKMPLVGLGMGTSSKAREDIFLETKIWPSSYESETAIDETLERLGTDYIDLLLLHPTPARQGHSDRLPSPRGGP